MRWSRTEHREGNARAWDARRDELRSYHADWLACWGADPGAEPCAEAAATGTNSTERAVAARTCSEQKGLRLGDRAAFARCLADRGHPEPRRPRWTRDDFGPRFDGSYVTTRALFAEDFGLPPATARALGWWRGVIAPLALVGGAGFLLRRRRAP